MKFGRKYVVRHAYEVPDKKYEMFKEALNRTDCKIAEMFRDGHFWGKSLYIVEGAPDSVGLLEHILLNNTEAKEICKYYKVYN